MQRGEVPSYSLPDICRLIREQRYQITRSATLAADKLGLKDRHILECVLSLHPDDFYKTMPSEKRPELWQDVYRPTYDGIWLYVKVQILTSRRTDARTAVVISFKRKIEVAGKGGDG